ncbi:MAG TPA: energy transducer TonB [Candidatus Acidoferrum sp.]|nr:energy transducer TonB [Candidatus Acidoferrum sp.]
MRAVQRTIAITGLLLALTGGTVSAQQVRKALSNPPPVYPELAQRLHISGSVKVTLIVGPDGLIKETQFHGGHPLLVEAVQKALKEWKYAPASTESAILVEFKF